MRSSFAEIEHSLRNFQDDYVGEFFIPFGKGNIFLSSRFGR